MPALPSTTGFSKAEAKEVGTMDEKVQLYSFIRSGAGIYTARIEQIDIQSAPAGQRALLLEIRIEETLWGNSGTPLRYCVLLEPESEIARLKFPDPIWGRVNVQKGIRIFFVTQEFSETPADPLYVEEIVDANDPVLSRIRAILQQQNVQTIIGNARLTRYLQSLSQGTAVQKLFAAEVLAKDMDFGNAEQQGQIATAFATEFASEPDLYVRLNVGTWMWDNIYSRTNAVGKVAILNATLQGAENTSPDIRRFCLDRLVLAEPKDLQQVGVTKSPEVVRLLQERLQLETFPEVRDRIQKVIDALQG
jgi:hypothetical protein